ncbi:MAG TPA: ATP-binding protein [Dongiaceae bacterium]|jgi:PAS domain S-box-containing protein
MRQLSDQPADDSQGSRESESPQVAATVLPQEFLNQIFQQELLDHGPAMYVADLEGRLLWSNAGFKRMAAAAGSTFLPLTEIAGEIALLGSMVFREDLLRLGDSMQRLRSRHVALKDNSGKTGAIAGIIHAAPEDPNRLETIADLRDRIDDMLRLVSDWVFETDAQLTLLHMSNRVTELLGFHPRELAGQKLLDLASGGADVAALEQCFQRHSPFRHQRCELVAKNGESKTVLISAVPVFNFHSGTLTGFRGTATDVTELRRREIGLQAAKEVAETANRAKTEFLASMSHELRTPLNAIIGFAEVMHMELLGPIGNRQYYGYVGDIHDSARHLLNLINDILDVAKIEAGRTELHEAPLDIRTLFDSAARLIRERSLRAQVQLEISVDQGLPAFKADDRKLKQVLINLLSNAVKYTPAGGKIRMQARRDEGGDLILTVADTGIGIPPGALVNVMEPFGQVDNAINRKYSGTGLGLPLTRGLVELHGGTMTLTSEQRVGTSVTIRLPGSRFASSGR